MEREKKDQILNAIERIRYALETLEAAMAEPKTGEITPEEAFKRFIVKYPGIKRGPGVEFEYFKAKNKDWRKVVFELEGYIDKQIRQRYQKEQLKQFVPEWKNLKTYLGNRSWEEIYSTGI